jgi:ATP-dependent Clp protease ATP-binding subunit ClpA/predicted DNA-binding transcriptional regulator AlpA
MSHHLLGSAEIAELLGVSRQRVSQLVASYPDFPPPEADLAAGRIWSRDAIEAWLARHPERQAGREEGRRVMFERATPRLEHAFVFAQEEARALKHNYVGCEHLVLALLRDPEGLAAKAMQALSFTLDDARVVLSQLLGEGSKEPDEGTLRFTPRVKRAIELAEQASYEFGHSYLGTEHLLLGMLREGENVGCRLLVEGGIDTTKLRLKLLELLNYPQPRGSASDADQEIPGDPASLVEVIERLDRIESLLQSLSR